MLAASSRQPPYFLGHISQDVFRLIFRTAFVKSARCPLRPTLFTGARKALLRMSIVLLFSFRSLSTELKIRRKAGFNRAIHRSRVRYGQRRPEGMAIKAT